MLRKSLIVFTFLLVAFGGFAEEQREQKAAAIVAFSRAIETYDRNEEGEAKKELVKAKQIDPDYQAAQVYLEKLVSNTAKFRFLTDAYYFYQNPAV